jgi:NhaA family Na+:H+ antiporter
MRPANSVVRLPHAIALPFQRYFGVEAAGGAILLAASVAALVWANLPGDTYHEAWGRVLPLDLGFADLDLTLEEWVSEALMTLFFFVVGLEIKREFVRGELSDARAAAFPIAAAVGGMIAPAAIYAVINLGGDGGRGWGIPMATDIAFSIGLLAIAASRIPLGLRVFLLALAIVDDLGAIAVIAIFYTDDLHFAWLITAVAVLAASVAALRTRVPWLVIVPIAGVICWLALHESGVHATIAGAALGLLTPAGAHTDTEDAQALATLEELLHPWVSYLIVPLFALVSAGVDLGGGAIGDATASRVTIGVLAGLVVGKPLGIVAASYLATRLGVAALPRGVGWSHVAGAGMVAGVGFTVSIFIAGLAFDDAALVGEAKIGILVGSAAAGALGLAVLRGLSPASMEQGEKPRFPEGEFS